MKFKFTYKQNFGLKFWQAALKTVTIPAAGPCVGL